MASCVLGVYGWSCLYQSPRVEAASTDPQNESDFREGQGDARGICQLALDVPAPHHTPNAALSQQRLSLAEVSPRRTAWER